MPPRPVIQKTQGDAASPVVVCQSRTRHRQFFQVPAQVLCCLPGMFRRLRKIHVPVNLSLLIFPLAEDKALPFIIIPDVSQLRRQNKRLPCRQQILAYIPYPARPDLRQGKRQFFPGTVLIYAAGGPRQVNMAVPVKLATIRVKSAENTGGQAPLLRSVQQVVRCGAAGPFSSQRLASNNGHRVSGIVCRAGTAYPAGGPSWWQSTGRWPFCRRSDIRVRGSSDGCNGGECSRGCCSEIPGCPSVGCRRPASL